MGCTQDRKGSNTWWWTAQKFCFPLAGQNSVRQCAESYCWCGETLGHFPGRPCTTVPVPGAALQPCSDMGPLETQKILPLPSESRLYWFQNLPQVSLWSLWMSGDPKLNFNLNQTQPSPVTFHPKELQELFWDTPSTPIPPESCLSHVCAAERAQTGGSSWLTSLLFRAHPFSPEFV